MRLCAENIVYPKMRIAMSRRTRISLSKLAAEYYDTFSDRHRRRLFNKEIERKHGHHLSLNKRITRKGYRKHKFLSPAIVDIIVERIGEP